VHLVATLMMNDGLSFVSITDRLIDVGFVVLNVCLIDWLR
jgi:hypothetical protein